MNIDSIIKFIEEYMKKYPECTTMSEFVKALEEHRDLERIVESLGRDRVLSNDWKDIYYEMLKNYSKSKEPSKNKTKWIKDTIEKQKDVEAYKNILDSVKNYE